MSRGRYIDSVRGQSSSPSPSTFLREFAEEKVQTPEREEEISPREKLIKGFQDESLSGAKRMMLGAALGASYLAGRSNTKAEDA